MRMPFSILTLLALAVAVPASANGQSNEIRGEVVRNAVPRQMGGLVSGRQSPSVLEAIAPLADKLNPLVVEIRVDNETIILGTRIAPDLVATKASELPSSQEITCVLKSGEEFPATIARTEREPDLAILRIESTDDQPMPPPDPTYQRSGDPAAPLPSAGRFVVSIFGDGHHPQLGSVIIEATSFDIDSPVDINKFDPGFEAEPFEIDEQIYRAQIGAQVETDDQPDRGPLLANHDRPPAVLKVTRVFPRSIAEQTGLLVDDVVLKLNDRTYSDLSELNSDFSSLSIGSKLKVNILRGDSIIILESRVPRHSRPVLHDRWGGGPFSRRRFSFPEVISHDTPLRPEMCGGPVIDLQGNLIGINISRSLRVSTLALPIKEVRRIAAETSSTPALTPVEPDLDSDAQSSGG